MPQDNLSDALFSQSLLRQVLTSGQSQTSTRDSVLL